jgi:hypothetical protein
MSPTANYWFSDVFHSGAIVTAVSALIALFSFIFIIHVLAVPSGSRLARALRVHGAVLAFCGVWLFASIVPFTFYFATRTAKVTASLNGIQLPSSLVNQAEQALGTTSVYKKISYCTVTRSFFMLYLQL